MTELQKSTDVFADLIDTDVSIEQWIAEWPAVRAKMEVLINEYARWHPAYDRNYADWMIEELEGMLRSLEYRLVWLEERT